MHHTGIKTSLRGADLRARQSFQLHHTGIKTDMKQEDVQRVLYFNCTIQELKPFIATYERKTAKFQLHHTGIKTGKRPDHPAGSGEFQLHHTGIKTIYSNLRAKNREISIAPYRN